MMSNKNPWEAHGHHFQAPTGPVQMFDPSKFQAGAAYGAPEAQPHHFDHGTYQKEAQEAQPHFANPSWNPQQQQHQGLYDSYGNVGHHGYGNSEYGWPPGSENPDLGAASDISQQYQGNFDAWQQDYYYQHGGYGESADSYSGEQQMNYGEQELGNSFNQIQNYPGNDTLPVGPNVGLNYPSGDNIESLGLEQGNESSYEAVSFCGSSSQVQPVTNFRTSDGQASNQQHLDSNALPEQQLPASNSFAKLPHHPSPFDEISGFVGEDVETEKSDRLNLPPPASHSRQNSSSGAKFILGSSEHIPGLSSKNASPPLTGKADHSEDECIPDQPSGKLAIDQHVDCGDITSGSTPRDNLHPCPPVGDSMTLPPSLAAGPGTMTGIPARNQFRKVPETKPSFMSDIAPGSLHIPSETMNLSDESGMPLPSVQCSGSGGLSTEGTAGTSPCIDSSQMHVRVASHVPDGSSVPVNTDPLFNQSVETGQDHQMNIYATPLTSHPGSSFVPVGPRSSSGSDNKTWSSRESGSDHAAMGSVDLGSSSQKDFEGQFHGGIQNPERHKDVLKFGVSSDNPNFNPSSFSSQHLQKQKSLVDNEVHKNERHGTSKDPEVLSHLHSVLPKLHREKTMSPAATLWENPDPLAGVGICLVPAAVVRDATPHDIPAVEHGKSDLGSGGSQPVHPVTGFDLSQNTGTGPGKNANVVPTAACGIDLGLGAKGSDGQTAAMGLTSNPKPLNRQTRDHDNLQQHDVMMGEMDEGSGSGVQGVAMENSGAVLQYTVMPVEAEFTPRIVAHVRNESIDSLTEEITKFGDSALTTKNSDWKTSQSFTKFSGESHFDVLSHTKSSESTGLRYPKDERSGGQEPPLSDSARESGKNLHSSDVNRLNCPASSRQENVINPDQMPERSKQNQRDNADVRQDATRPNRTGSVQDNRTLRDSEHGLPRNQRPSNSDQHEMRHPNEKPNSRHASESGVYGDVPPVSDYPQNPNDRQGYPQGAPEGSRSRHDYPSDYHDRPRSRQGYAADGSYARPSSRQGYSEDTYSRPRSRQGYPEDPHGRPRSRQGYPEDPDGRPRSRQGYPEDPHGRPRSRQGYPEDPHGRPRSRQGYPDEVVNRPSSRQDYPGRDRPQSRPSGSDEYWSRSRQGQGYHGDDRPRSRQDYPEDQYNRPRSRQDYPVDHYDRKRPREGYPSEYYDRPRSRQGHPSAYPDDPQGRFHYYENNRKQGQGYYERSRARQEYEFAEGDRRGYSDRYQEDPRSRRGYRDDYDSKVHRGYSDESYERPRSRQQENENSHMPYDDPEQSYYRSRHGSDRTRSDYGRRSRDDRDREHYDYDEYYREYYNRYMQYVYQHGGYQQYYPYQYPNRYDKGYLEEMAHYGQIPVYDPRFAYEEVGKAQSGSRHDSTRGSSRNSPAHDHSSSAADNFARGSRPGSSFSGTEPSPLAVESRYNDFDPYGQPYGYPDQILQQEPVRHRMTPVKFIVPHTRASFGPTGQLVHVLPNSPADGQPGVVELIDVASLLTGSLEMDELKKFPGPLIRHETHKNDVLLYCQKMALECRNSVHLVDRESAELMWHYLELLIKQNGTVIGTDVADLLLKGHEPTSSVYEKTDLDIACSREDLNVDEYGSSFGVDRSMINKSGIEIGVDEVTDRFRHLLLHGRKKDALEWAMKKNLWGHALFLASKMDAKTHANIMTRFANTSMKMNDPLQTLYQIMSGRQPAAVTLIVDDKWGDWRPHLCIILSNPTQKVELDKKSIVTLGDTLASRGLFFAAQFCYMVAQVPFGHYHKKSSKIVLVGASHSSPFEEFVTNFAIQCTETYEYGLSLATPNFVLQAFQLYKFIYMLRLIDYGFLEEALKYAEVLAGIIVQAPSVYPPTLVKALYNLSHGLRFCDPQRLLMDETEEIAWFQQLQQVVQRIEEGSILYQSGHGTPVGGFSTGASSEVAEILGHSQANEFGQPSVNYTVGNVTTGGTGAMAYPDSQGHWSQGQTEYQQMVWNPATQSHDRYVYRDNQWILVPDLVDPQQTSLYPSGVAEGATTLGFAADPVYQAVPTGVTDVVDGATSQGAAEAVDHFSESGSHFKPGSLGFGSSGVQDLTSSSGSGFNNRQRTISSSSSHSQQPLSSRRTSVSTVHGPTPPATPGHQASNVSTSLSQGILTHSSGLIAKDSTNPDADKIFQFGVPPPASPAYTMSGSTAPLGAAPPGQKKRQWWPGEEPDENENNSSKTSKDEKQMTKNKDASKSTGWLGGIFSRISRPKEMILPDDKNPKIVWDKEKKRWINTDEDPNEAEQNAQPLAPPKDFEVTQKLSTPTMPSPSPSELSGNKFSRQKIRGARGQYVDVFGSSSKPSPAAPNNLLNMLPKSASMPPNVFIPNARASEEEEELTEHQKQHVEPAEQNAQPLANPKTLDAAQGHQIKQTLPENASNPPAMLQPQQPSAKTSEIVNPIEGTPFMPRMFDPAQFSGGQSNAPLTPASSSNTHMKYGQRRIYPK